jgi:UDP-4-amino-4,6-dideoxy-L-N-acetyl-beta-L-altrosamine transaminase
MIAYSKQMIEQDDIDSVEEALKSDFLTTGPKVEEFEKAISEYVGSKYCVVFNSATSALLAAYYCLDLKDGDEVITTPISFVATSNMLLHYNAKPVFVDVDENGNIDHTKIEEKITDKTKAIVSVDIAGNPVEYDKISQIAKDNNLHFISDASHALGSEFKGKKVGSLADMSIFSFHAIKPITTLEGGAVTTDSEEYYNKMKLFSSHGIVKDCDNKPDMIQMGYNLRLSDVACALGVSQLKKLDTFIEKREMLALYYDDIFEDGELFDTLHIKPYKKSSYHLYPIYLRGDLDGKRDAILEKLKDKGTGAQVHYRPIYQNSYYKELFGEMSLESVENYYKNELSIPCHQSMSMDDAVKVVDTIIEAIQDVLGVEPNYDERHDITEADLFNDMEQ